MIELYASTKIGIEKIDVKFWTFPAGERGVKVESPINGDSVSD